MKRLLILPLLLTGVFAADTSTDKWELNGRLNMYLQTINVVGNPQSSREGNTNNEELNLNLTGPLANGEAGVETRFRHTNDERVQVDNTEVLYLRSYFRNKEWGLEAGDVAASYNPYIYSGSLKGVKVAYKSPQKARTWDYSGVLGVKKTSWRDTYTSDSTEEAMGYAGAFSVKYRHERAKEIALSVAALDTDMSTGGVDNNTTLGKRGYAVGLDGKWRFNKYITLKGRGAVTDGTDDKLNDKKSSFAKAINVQLLTRPVLSSVKSNFKYERVDSDFISFGGTANSDKEELENSTTWRINKQFQARMDLKANRNDLDDTKIEGSREIYYEAASLQYKPEFLKRSEFNFRISNKDTKTDIGDTGTVITGVDFSLRQKGNWRYGAGYDYSDVSDDNATTSNTHTIRALVAYRQALSKTRSYRFTIKPNYQIIEDLQNKAGLRVDAGYIHNKKLSANLFYMINDTSYDDLSSLNNRQNSTYRFNTTYKLDEKGRDSLRLLLEKRDIEIDTDDINSYSEYIGRVSLVMNF